MLVLFTTDAKHAISAGHSPGPRLPPVQTLQIQRRHVASHWYPMYYTPNDVLYYDIVYIYTHYKIRLAPGQALQIQHYLCYVLNTGLLLRMLYTIH